MTPQQVKKYSRGRYGRPRPKSAFESLMPKTKPIKDEELSVDLIQQSKFPAAKKPPPNQLSKVERDDWPGPPFPPLIKRWWSKSVGDIELDALDSNEETKMKEEVDNMTSALGKEILREEIERTKLDNLNPRSASRTPSAKTEPPVSTRYMSSANALGGGRSATLPENMRNMSLSEAYRRASSLPAGSRNGPPSWFNDGLTNGYRSPSGFRSPPAYLTPTGYLSPSGYLSPTGTGYQSPPGMYGDGYLSPNGYNSDADFSQMGSSEGELRMMRITRGRSLPSIIQQKIYPLGTLLTTNYRLPKDVDRNNLELHLSQADFYRVFQMSYEEYFMLPRWRQVELKKLSQLF